ncbi:MAG: pyruvate kinase [Candidatus Rokuibacteriota bacterium]|nr:MAG: pyruvate kinase [Candidatus Rokubacteria bacterium]
MRVRTSLLLKRRRTKIVATLGPASSPEPMIDQLIQAGVDVFRLNMSHGQHADHQTAYERVRVAAARLDRPVAVLADLCGPKIRVGRFKSGAIPLQTGGRATITTRDVLGQAGLIPSQYEGLAEDVRPGDHILLDDGFIDLQVEGVQGTEVACVIVHGGLLKDRKGMNLPGVRVSAESFTPKDHEDTEFALKLGVDFLALSFVREAAEVTELKKLVAAAGSSAQVLAKIEMAEALEHIDEILEASDGIMAARGDLGVELPLEEVPLVQRTLVARARAAHKPILIATQMLESMIERARPTRAEATDVAWAVLSGADAVMLSAESASGAHPLLAVEALDRIARQVEGHLWQEGAFDAVAEPSEGGRPLPLDVAVARATSQLSRDLRVRTVVVPSRTGATARMVAAARPAAPVVAVSSDVGVCRRLNLLWGVVPISATAVDLGRPAELARRVAHELGLASTGDFLLVVSGFRGGAADNAPAITVLPV